MPKIGNASPVRAVDFQTPLRRLDAARPMPDESRPLRSGRYYSEAELSAAALAAVHRVVGHGKAYPTRTALIAGLNERIDAENAQHPERKAVARVTAPALSAALALADRPATTYDRGASVRRLILRMLPPGFAVASDPRWTGEPDPSGVLPAARSAA